MGDNPACLYRKLTGRKIACRTGDSNPSQYYFRLALQSDSVPTELPRPQGLEGLVGVDGQCLSGESD